MKTLAFGSIAIALLTVWERENVQVAVSSYVCALLMVQNTFKTLCHHIQLSVLHGTASVVHFVDLCYVEPTDA